MFDSPESNIQIIIPQVTVKPKSRYTIEDFLLYCDEILGRKQIFTSKVDVSKLKKYADLLTQLDKIEDKQSSKAISLVEQIAPLENEIKESGLMISRKTVGATPEMEDGKVKYRVRQLPKKPLLINPRDIKNKKEIEDVYIQSGVNYILASDVKVLLLTGENLFSDINTTAQTTAENSFKMELDNQIKRRLQIYLSNIEGKNESETANEREKVVKRIADSLVNKWGRNEYKDLSVEEKYEMFGEEDEQPKSFPRFEGKKDLFSEEGPMDYDDLISKLTVDVERVIEEDLDKPMDDVLQNVELEKFVEEANVMPVDTEKDLVYESVSDFREDIVERLDKETNQLVVPVGMTSKYDVIDTITTVIRIVDFFTGNDIGFKKSDPIYQTLKDGKVDLKELEPILKKHLDEIKRAIIDGMQDKMKEIIEEHRHFYRATRIRRGYQKRAGGVGEIAGEDAYTGMRETLVGEKKGIIKTLLEIKLLEE
jgi:hypothetical protein